MLQCDPSTVEHSPSRGPDLVDPPLVTNVGDLELPVLLVDLDSSMSLGDIGLQDAPLCGRGRPYPVRPPTITGIRARGTCPFRWGGFPVLPGASVCSVHNPSLWVQLYILPCFSGYGHSPHPRNHHRSYGSLSPSSMAAIGPGQSSSAVQPQ